MIHCDKSLCPCLPSDQCALFGMTSCWPAQDGREVAKILQQHLRQLPSAGKRVESLWLSHPWLLHSQSRPQALRPGKSCDDAQKYWGMIPPPLTSWEEKDAHKGSEIISDKDMSSSIQLQAMSKPAMLTPPPFLTNAERLSSSVIIMKHN